MTAKDYLDTRRRQDTLLAHISDSTPMDDPKIDELFALQDDCDAFERVTFHKVGYTEVQLELEPELLVKTIRKAHENGMNLSDYVSMVLTRYMDEDLEFTWTTDIRNLSDFDPKEVQDAPTLIPEDIRRRLGWEAGDFIRITASKDGLRMKKFEIE